MTTMTRPPQDKWPTDDDNDNNMGRDDKAHIVTRRQLPWVDGSLREVLTKRRYILRVLRKNGEVNRGLMVSTRGNGVDKRSMTGTLD